MPSTTPPLAELIAADLLREAQRILYHRDYPIVVAVVGHGQTLREVAGGTFALRGAVAMAGQRLREGLDELAEHWVPRGTGRSRSWRDNTGQDVSRVSEVMRGRIAHASRRGVRMS